jgi:hypothetical protein
VERQDFRCECAAMVNVALCEREGLPGTVVETFFTGQCFDCGRRFDHLEIELILYQRMLLQHAAERTGV